MGGAIIGIAVGFIVHRLLQKFWKPKPAESLPKIAQESNLFAKKVVCRTLFGSNLVLANREARLRAPSGEDSSGQNQWAALRAANEKVGQFSESQIVVELYNSARTFFERN